MAGANHSKSTRIRSQGEDLKAGVRTTRKIRSLSKVVDQEILASVVKTQDRTKGMKSMRALIKLIKQRCHKEVRIERLTWK
jgi:hypothetical protein